MQWEAQIPALLLCDCHHSDYLLWTPSSSSLVQINSDPLLNEIMGMEHLKLYTGGADSHSYEGKFKARALTVGQLRTGLGKTGWNEWGCVPAHATQCNDNKAKANQLGHRGPTFSSLTGPPHTNEWSNLCLGRKHEFGQLAQGSAESNRN